MGFNIGYLCKRMKLGKMLFDIGISGAGHTGLSAAIALAKKGFSVLLIDPQDRANGGQTELDQSTHIQRTTACLNQATAFLKSIDVWDFLEPNACPLQHLRIINQQKIGSINLGTSQTIFSAEEIGESQFGFNVPLAESLLALKRTAEQEPLIDLKLGLSLFKLKQFNEYAELHLSNGQKFCTKLVIGADGGQSSVRHLASIPFVTKNTGQTVLSFNIVHQKPHKNISTEIYSEGGPFTLVPLRSTDGKNSSAVVWMQKKFDAQSLLRLTPARFLKVVDHATRGILGEVNSCSVIGKKEITIKVAGQVKNGRAILLGEAAHLLPPIGAQGFNLSVQEICNLTKLAVAYRDRLGSEEMVQDYQAQVLPESLIRSSGVGLLNLVAFSSNPASQIGREIGLTLLRQSPALRRFAMHFGLFNATKLQPFKQRNS